MKEDGVLELHNRMARPRTLRFELVGLDVIFAEYLRAVDSALARTPTTYSTSSLGLRSAPSVIVNITMRMSDRAGSCYE